MLDVLESLKDKSLQIRMDVVQAIVNERVKAIHEQEKRAVTLMDFNLYEAACRCAGRFIGGINLEEAIQPTAFPQLFTAVVKTTAFDIWQYRATDVRDLVTVDPDVVQTTPDKYPMFNAEKTGMSKVRMGQPAQMNNAEERYSLADDEQEYRDEIPINWTVATRKPFIMQTAITNKVSECKAQETTQIVNALTDSYVDDQGTSKYIYKPQGTGGAIYSSGNKNTTVAAFTADYSAFETARAYIVANQVLPNSRVFPFEYAYMIVPNTLATKAEVLMKATSYKTGADSGAVQVMHGQLDKLSALKLRVIPELDAKSTTVWYLGNPARQLILREFKPFAVTPLGPDVRCGIAQSYVFEWIAGMAAIDHRFICRLTAS